MARLRSAASYSRRWISRDKHTPTRTLGVAMEPILVTTPKALAYKALPPHFHSKTMARDDSPRLECWSSSSRRLLPRLHVSMKTCKHASMNSLMVCSASAAATLMALMSSRGQRTCNGTGFGCAGSLLLTVRGAVAALGLTAFDGTRASGVRAVGLAIRGYRSLRVHACML